MTTNEILFLLLITFCSLCVPLTASGVLRWRRSEPGPVQLMGQFGTGAGVIGIASAILTVTGLLPTAFFLLTFAVSFGLGAWMLGAFLDKSGQRLPEYVMLFWVVIAATLLLTRSLL